MTPLEIARSLNPKHRPPLDPDFVPPVLWNNAFRHSIKEEETTELIVRTSQPGGTDFVHRTYIGIDEGTHRESNYFCADRMLKFILWGLGGSQVAIDGPVGMVEELAAIYAPGGERALDAEFIGKRIFLERLKFHHEANLDIPLDDAPPPPLGGNLDSCRIGFDLGGSDRKAAAVRHGEVVFSEEIPWDPYFQADPDYHYQGIMDSLKRAAAHLPRVDAIGGSAAGVYIDNEPRVASLFRVVTDDVFAAKVRPLFKRIAAEFGVPLTVVNDGDVTALAAAQMLGERRKGGVLGLAFGTSLAAGYVSPGGHLTPWLNELAFVPVDYRTAEQGGHVDEWSGDAGTGVRYFSQQALTQLAPAAGFDFGDLPLPEQLVEVQQAMAAGDERAAQIYRSYGVYLGYSLAHFRQYYDFAHVLILGRVTSGPGGAFILEKAKEVLADEFPQLAAKLDFIAPDETFKRHGQSIAAASLPALAKQPSRR